MKTFSRDSLSAGDKINIPGHKTTEYIVVETLEHTFAFTGTSYVQWISYDIAIKEGWTIIQKEEQNENISTVYTHASMQNKVIEGIIKNNNELIVELRNRSKVWPIKLGDIIQLIQSKNDLLSKE